MCESQRQGARFAYVRANVLVSFMIACLMALPSSFVRAASTFGDIVVAVKSVPKGQSSHGYSEYVFILTNQSSHRAHSVTLVMPRDSITRGRDDCIHSLSRTVQVEPKTTLQVSLLHPDYPVLRGNGLRVIIDGREQEDGISLPVSSGYRGMSQMSQFRNWRTMGPADALLVLVSPRVGDKFRIENQANTKGAPPGRKPSASAPPPVPANSSPSSSTLSSPPVAQPVPAKNSPLSTANSSAALVGLSNGEVVRSEEPVGNWSSSWLSYSRYDAIVLTRDELEELARGPADSQVIRKAILQYVEAGGALLILGAGPIMLPGSWQPNQETRHSVRICHGGFGLCLQTDQRDTSTWSSDTWSAVVKSWSQTAAPYRAEHHLKDTEKALPILENSGLPVRGMFLLLVLFTIAIGPCNLWLLGRWKRRIWLLWTFPAFSLFTCAAVFGALIAGEGWQGRTRVVAFTLLDETEQRATTLGRSASYSPLTPSDGLHFSQDTEVMIQRLDHSGSSASVCDMDWTKDQNLRRGWVSARVPAHFQLRRSEIKRLERLPVTREKDGTLQVTNQLGASIRNLWLADEKGTIYTAEAIEVGQRAPLIRSGKTVSVKSIGAALRKLYTSTEWANLGETVIQSPQTHLAPRTYLAVIESSPFLEPGLTGAMVRPTDSYILGIMSLESLVISH